MKKSLLVAIVGLMVQPALAQEENKALELKSFSVREVVEAPSAVHPMAVNANFADCNNRGNGLGTSLDVPVLPNDGGLENPLDMLDVVVDKIINIGKKIWAVIEAGKPVVDMKFDVAHALPQGLYCWADLAGWSIPQSKVYEVAYRNGFDMEVVKFSYRIVYTAGGNYKNAGKYIANATVMPKDVYVAWGFNLDVRTEVPLVFNSGSVESPVGGMQMDVHWKVYNAINYSERAESFYLGGNGDFKKLD